MRRGGRGAPLLASLLGTVLALALAAACGPPTENSRPAATPQTLVAAALGDLENINDTLTQSSFSQDVLARLFVRLAEEQPASRERLPEFTPQAAERWEFSPDRLSLTFHLRRDLRWSDGAPLTAGDVVFTWKAQTAPAVAWAGRDIKDQIVSVEAVDALTVQFKFRRAYPHQLMDANDGFILPRHAWEKVPLAGWESHDWKTAIVTSGPFTLAAADWIPRQSITLRRNPEYPLPRGDAATSGVDRVVFRIIPDQASQVEQLLAGDVDLVDGVPPRRAADVAKSPVARLAAVADRQYTYVGWNLRHPQLADRELRRALSLAVDRQQIIDALWYGYASPSRGPIPSGMWGANPRLPVPAYDPAEAKRLLASLGCRDSDGDGILERNGRPLSFRLLTNSGNQIRQDTATLLAAQLARVGVELKTELRDSKTLLAALRGGDFDAYLLAWRLGTKCDLKPYWHSASIGKEQNFVGYRNPRVDAAIDAARELDLAAAQPHLDLAQELIAADHPYLFLYEPKRLLGLSRRIEGAEPNSLSTYFHLERWRMAPRSRRGAS